MNTICRAAQLRATALCVMMALAACSPSSVENNDMDAATTGFAHLEWTISDLQQAMIDGTLSSQALTQAYLERIAAIDDAGPALNAVIELNPDALADARRLDEERAAGRSHGPLHGIPILLKDNIDAVPMVNSAGSLALAGHRPEEDAYLVGRLREAGAVILGKTNLSEWANARSTRSSSGWSGRGGQTLNPYVLDRSPCGSSSGTATAIAASLATAGIGTETNGSILCPASVTGLVGLKPTVGLVSRHGIIPLAESFDTAGPMSRSVTDAAILLEVLQGVDTRDPATSAIPSNIDTDYLAALDTGQLQGARIGVLRNHRVTAQPDVEAAFASALRALEAAGAILIDVEIATVGQWGGASVTVMHHELKAGLNHYLSTTEAPIASLAEIIAFNREHADTSMPWFAQEFFEAAEATGGLESPGYRDALANARHLAGEQGLLATLRTDDLDAVVAPTTGPAWPIDLVNGDNFTGANYGVAAIAGTPSITVPMGDAHGLPLGLVFMGPAWSEARLLGLAYAFEQATQARRPPHFLPTIRFEPKAEPGSVR